MNPPMMSVEWRRVEASDLGALHRLHVSASVALVLTLAGSTLSGQIQCIVL